MVNKKLLTNTLKLIKENPGHWNQGMWHCGTTHCFAGFVECQMHNVDVRAYFPTEETNTRKKAKEELGLNSFWSDTLFYSGNTLHDLEIIVHALTTDDVDSVIPAFGKLDLCTYETVELLGYYAGKHSPRDHA